MVKSFVRAVCGFAVVICSNIQAQAFELDRLETDDLILLYSDPLQT